MKTLKSKFLSALSVRSRHLPLMAFSPALLALVLLGCASADPMITNQPQDWKGKPAVDLKTALGEPTRIIQESTGAEVWEYVRAEKRILPKGEDTRINLGFLRGGSAMSGGGVVSSEKRPEDRICDIENRWRFKVLKGKIVGWYAACVVDGKIVREDY